MHASQTDFYEDQGQIRFNSWYLWLMRSTDSQSLTLFRGLRKEGERSSLLGETMAAVRGPWPPAGAGRWPTMETEIVGRVANSRSTVQRCQSKSWIKPCPAVPLRCIVSSLVFLPDELGKHPFSLWSVYRLGSRIM